MITCKIFRLSSRSQRVNLSVEPGETVAVIGRSGSGKSTMLRCINGLELFNAGSIEVVGHKLYGTNKRLRDLRKEVGMVFQSYNLFPHLTVAENIKLAPRIVKNVPKAEQDSLVNEVLSKVGLLEKKTPIRIPIRRATAARSDCTFAGDEAQSHAV